MVIDTSAIAAVAFGEPEAESIERAIVDDPVRLISAATLFEASVVIEGRQGELGGREFDLWAYRIGLEIVSVDAEQLSVMRQAWRRFGKGRHPAGLNFGDCFSYALAVARNEPLLFKGDDFARTDVVSVKLGQGQHGIPRS